MKKDDFLLVYPKPTGDSPTCLTPLSILFPGALFEKMGKQVVYFDERFDSDDILVDLIKSSNEIGVSCFTGYQSGRAARILKLAKQINSKIITGVGGVHPRLLPEQVLAESFIDKVWTDRVYGEDLFPYNERTKVHFQRTDMQYFTSRGCPFSCAFCALRSDWEPKDIRAIDRELKIIHADIGFKTISFTDPNISFCSYKENGKVIKLDKIKRIRQIGAILRDINVKWDGNIRSPDLSPEMFEALVYSNCYSLEIGCESGNDYFLTHVIRKGHGVDAIKNAVKNNKGSGISIMYSFIAHMPREKPEYLLDTMDLIDYIVENDPTARISIFSYAPYPGSPMYQDALKGVEGFPKFTPPTNLEGWGGLHLMQSAIYWIAGLCFRLDNTKKNFPGNDWKIIEPYIELAKKKWKDRDIKEFPCNEVEMLISTQMEKHRKKELKTAQ